MTTAEPDYDIFEYLEEYLQKEDLIKPNDDTYNTFFCFRPSDLPFMSEHNVMNIFKKFVIFFEKLKDAYRHDTTKYSKYREYLNYWLTYKLVSIAFPDRDKPKFYEFIQSNYNLFSADGELYDKIYQIKDSNFNNMYILYELYRLYHELEDNNLNKCKNFYEKCVKNYNSALHKCYFDDPKLCNPLEKFKNFYDRTRSSMLHKCVEKGLPILPNFVKPQPSNGKKFMNKLAYYIYQLSNKQNEDELSIISNANYPNLIKFFSFNYNMPLYSDEQEKRKDMINILYEFIKFCKESNTITFLDSLIRNLNTTLFSLIEKNSVSFINSFIKEFFENFYNDNKYEYEQIYEKCFTDKTYPSYCTVYNECNILLGAELYSVKDNIQELLGYKETRTQELTPEGLSKDIPLLIKAEDSVISNTTPINVGVGVGALFTLSFLYKFTPLGSWVNRTFLGRANTIYNCEEENGQDFFNHNSGFDNYISENERFTVAYGSS
ncbi:PIR Superfamily Protein [Plasmodium ovale curtisi]|uniref:PIR Superfamily Protein n=1 Tax=Plasmodium ovale curtisi TaxID=864141 RepID=A0A1A8VZD1_PLAOA|nr:PIR Superfamily Protein [Plasmodium ovale curtisi]SBT01767.1 PIR Superfamily Protein [Plasmodium ovale curtisi]